MIVAAMALIGIGCAPVLHGLAVHLRQELFAGPLCRAGLLDGRLRHGRQRHRRVAARQRGGGFRLAPGNGGARRVHAPDCARRRASGARSGRARGSSGPSSGFAGYRELLRLRVLWPIIPLAVLNYAPTSGIRGLWAGPSLSRRLWRGRHGHRPGDALHGAGHGSGSFLYGPLGPSCEPANGWRQAATRSACWRLFISRSFRFRASSARQSSSSLWPVRQFLRAVDGACARLRAGTLAGRGVTLMNFPRDRRGRHDAVCHRWRRHCRLRARFAWVGLCGAVRLLRADARGKPAGVPAGARREAGNDLNPGVHTSRATCRIAT